jgi:tetratricopeptide (TPR) repeat protein
LRIPAAPRRLLGSPPFAAAVLGFALFLPSLGGGFLYDDAHVVVGNRAIRDLSRLGTVLSYEPARPLLNLSWAFSYAAGGLDPWHWHLVNVALHAADAALVASLFLWMAGRRGLTEARRAAMIGAALFAVTPMACETVAYVSSRSTALASLFSLAAIRVALPGLESGSRRRLAAAVGLLLLGLATKEEAAAVPLLLLLLDWIVLSGGSFASLRSRLARHAPFLAVLALGFAGRRAVTGQWLPAPVMDRARYVFTQLAELPGYVLRAAVPVDPALYRGMPPSPWPPGAPHLIWAFAGVVLLATAVALRRRQPLFALAVLWMAVALLPSSSLVPLQEMVVDHRAYLGGAGVAFALGSLLAAPRWRAAAAVLLIALCARTLHYQWVLADPVRAWSDATGRAPHAVQAWLALADAHAAAGEGGEAGVAFRRALSLDPGNFRASTNLGAWLAEQGRYPEAVEHFRTAARVAPDDARVRDNLGMLLLALGREQEALAEFEAAVAGRPVLAQPRINLAALLLRFGARERATALLDEAAALEIDARDAAAIESIREALR